MNYESRGLIKPDIKEGASGNRYYTIDTLTMIRTVRIFQRLGLSLDEIHGYFCGSTDLTKLIIRLETMRDELNLNIEKLYERVNKSVYNTGRNAYKKIISTRYASGYYF